MRWALVPVIEPLTLRTVYEHMPLDPYRYGEYPRFIRPPHFDGRTEWKRVAENAQPAIRTRQIIDPKEPGDNQSGF